DSFARRLADVAQRIVGSCGDLGGGFDGLRMEDLQREQVREPAFRGLQGHDRVERAVERHTRTQAADGPQQRVVPRLPPASVDQCVPELGTPGRLEPFQAREGAPRLAKHLWIEVWRLTEAKAEQTSEPTGELLLLRRSESRADAQAHDQPLDLALHVFGMDEA